MTNCDEKVENKILICNFASFYKPAVNRLRIGENTALC